MKLIITLEYRDEIKALVETLRTQEEVDAARVAIAKEWRNVRRGIHSPRAMKWEAENGLLAIVSRNEFRAIEARGGQV